MNTDTFVIACRSYKRANLFLKMTYSVVERNQLADKLYIFVSTSDDVKSYTETLQGKQYAKIVLGPPGINAITNFICDYFEPNQRIVFMDDDNLDFYFFTEDKRCNRKATNLKDILEDGFETIDKYNLGLFGVYFCSNKAWIKDKPFKEFAPFPMTSALCGARNQKHLLTDLDSDGTEDHTRSMRYWDAFGGTLLYWWCGITSHPTEFEGGLKDNPVRTLDYTYKQIKGLTDTNPTYRQFCSDEPKLETKYQKYSFRYLTLPKRKAIVLQKNPNVQFYRWSNWFQQEPNKIEQTKS